ncbi:MAG: hypothetical protein QG649_731 [Patescibacteria group bacterium]|nr:hypothetical protein [Patescibacteria group bacterium]
MNVCDNIKQMNHEQPKKQKNVENNRSVGSYEQARDDVTLYDIRNLALRLPSLSAESEFGLPSIELPEDNRNDEDVPFVVLVRKKHVDYLGVDVEAPKSVTRFDVPYYVVGHNDEEGSLLVVEATVDPYDIGPQTRERILTQGRHRQALLPKPDATPEVFTLQTTSVGDRIRNMPSVRRKLGTHVMSKTVDGSPTYHETPEVLPVYKSPNMKRVSTLDEQLLHDYDVQDTFTRLQAAYADYERPTADK